MCNSYDNIPKPKNVCKIAHTTEVRARYQKCSHDWKKGINPGVSHHLPMPWYSKYSALEYSNIMFGVKTYETMDKSLSTVSRKESSLFLL